MTTSRKTRAERLQETRQRLLAAASDIIAQGGVAEATIRGVCHRAGFSQGAFYTSFASKDDLLLALLGENMQQAISGIEALLTEPAPAGAEVVDRLVATVVGLGQNTVAARLAVELHLHAQRDPAFSAPHQRLLDVYYSRFSEVLQALADRADCTLLIDARRFPRMIHTLWLGGVVQNNEASDDFREALAMTCRAAIRHARPKTGYSASVQAS